VIARYDSKDLGVVLGQGEPFSPKKNPQLKSVVEWENIITGFQDKLLDAATGSGEMSRLIRVTMLALSHGLGTGTRPWRRRMPIAGWHDQPVSGRNRDLHARPRPLRSERPGGGSARGAGSA